MGGPDRNSLGVAGGALIVLIALIILVTRLTPIWGGYDPWIDESMLLSSFPLESWAALFRPLPLFEQATPLGHAVLLHITTGIFPRMPLWRRGWSAQWRDLLPPGSCMRRFAG